MTKKIAKKAASPSRKAAPPKPPYGRAELGRVHKKLLEMRDDLTKTVRKQQVTEADESGDAADQASLSIEREILFELSDNERVTLDQIEAALRKIDKGSYGLCESCQKPILKARLEALPFARYCISCQSTSERVPEAVEAVSDFRSLEEEPR